MAGIYIHIPFCKQACYYCNFHFSTSLKLKTPMMAALVREMQLHTDEVNAQTSGMIVSSGEQIESLYLGGGTPSLLTADELNCIISSVRQFFNLDSAAEITLEANPDDMNRERIAQWKHAGINRLSVGIQSFNADHLSWMNRAHTAAQAIDSLPLIRDAGIENYSVDLIYGFPGLSDAQWIDNMKRVVDARVPHIASYALTVEPRTALKKMIALGKKEDVDDRQQAAHFELLMDTMQRAGYEHYEISNFSLPGYRSRHNSSYWQGKKYLGIGPSAHSFDGNKRYWNIANNALYLDAIKNNQSFFESETLTLRDHLNEYIMTSLRTQEGLDLSVVDERFGTSFTRELDHQLRLINKDWLRITGNIVQLTNAGKLFADQISSSLFFETQG